MDRRDLAIRFQKAALERRAISFGPTHVDSRASLQITADISRLLAEDGQLDEAERLAQDALRGLKAYNRPAGPGTIKAMRTLAFVSRSRGQIGKSETILQEILKLQEENCGAEHINTLLTVGELAELHMQCHEYHKAIPLYTRALTCLERKDHHMTQDLHNRLNAALQRNQRWWWSMLRIIFTGFRIPFRLILHLKSTIARLART
jgi:tetratricopeptide (TPR) repeat protein